ncbi:MAG: Calcineurin-like phosphoesterase [Bacteroidetes bacterium ADurb.BinA261]|jgi:predicted phosphodiesterase|nr:metallophosphoesterase family protein [Dysgonamonadaceae bacterium]OPZ13237.1 MAG: Calcineurin-like phosphoesterase [Bacteroidetes bacterium ADurb.BinA261]HOV35369.1 metallophosphoesterase family protein [Dysgonamonadaceae bacterium]HQG07137.1 metallophosphoesterase family protein [Dysgonamonadaceae bacterium]HQI42565.1 metallophosphoesterase family protein [Dysgonamonadaceae bacterium]
MNKLFGIFILLLASFIHVHAQKISFDRDGLLKIVQFTDIHYIYNDAKADTTLLNIERILDAENPDLIVFTGDIVTGKPVEEGWDAITRFAIDRKIPFAVTLGNHDDEQGTTRTELENLITSYPYNINGVSSSYVDGVLNNVIPVYGSDNNMKIKALLYTFDSGAYSTIQKVNGYGWIHPNIISWYRRQSIHYTIQNNFQPLPALAFFHIPLPEYRLAYDDAENKRIGDKNENECSPALNSGMFLAMKEMGDIMGTFVGHDHVNNYLVNYFDIALGYGQFSGWKTTYVAPVNGARIIVLKENKREFDTWIRTIDGNIQFKATYPVDFIQSAKK